MFGSTDQPLKEASLWVNESPSPYEDTRGSPVAETAEDSAGFVYKCARRVSAKCTRVATLGVVDKLKFVVDRTPAILSRRVFCGFFELTKFVFGKRLG